MAVTVEDGGVAAEPFGGHDGVGVRLGAARTHVVEVDDVAVGDHRDAHVLLHLPAPPRPAPRARRA